MVTDGFGCLAFRYQYIGILSHPLFVILVYDLGFEGYTSVYDLIDDSIEEFKLLLTCC